jgi:hypothetical protein
MVHVTNLTPGSEWRRYTEGSWRVGGVLALSRAFGDAFLKESGRFEGFGERNADYGSGFGLNAEPDCYIEQLSEAGPPRCTLTPPDP